MANTLKFGNENWATKKDSILAYNDENDNFKPLPFVTSRASTATRVNKAGLLETVASGIPRVDYLGNTKGAYLLEPQSTNSLKYSEDLTNTTWLKVDSSVSSNQTTSPDGTQNADKYIEGSASGQHRMYQDFIVSSGSTVTISVKAKKGERNWFVLYESNSSKGYFFDLENGVVGSYFVGVPTSYSIELLADGWYNVSITVTLPASNARVIVYLAEANGSNSYQGNGTSGIYLWGFQGEGHTYPTSYIPTSGSAITKLADTASQTVPDGVIGQTEGTIYSDVNFVGVTQSITNQIFFIRELNSNNGYIFAGFYQGKLNVGLRVDGSTKFDLLFGSVLTKGRYKIAVVYSSGDTKVFINGSKVGSTMTQTFGVNNFAQIYNGNGSLGTNQLGDINRDFRIYNTVLTDAELVTLTTI